MVDILHKMENRTVAEKKYSSKEEKIIKKYKKERIEVEKVTILTANVLQ